MVQVVCACEWLVLVRLDGALPLEMTESMYACVWSCPLMYAVRCAGIAGVGASGV